MFFHNRKLQGFQHFLFQGGHGAAGPQGLDTNHAVEALHVGLDTGHTAKLAGEIVELQGAAIAKYEPTGLLLQGEGANGNPGGGAAGEFEGEFKVVVHRRGQNTQEPGVNADYLFIGVEHQELIDQVHAPVVKHTTAGNRITPPAEADTPVPKNGGFDGGDLANISRTDSGNHFQVIHVPTAILVYREDLAGFGRNRHHFLQFGRRHGDRLFAKHVLAGLHAKLGVVGVVVVGGGNHNQVQGECQEFLHRGAGLQTLFPGVRQGFFLDVVDGNQGGILGERADLSHVEMAHVAKTNNTNLNRHSIYLSYVCDLVQNSGS